MDIQERLDAMLEVQTLYDELLKKQEKRNISYGEMVYIQNLDDKELVDLYNEISKELEVLENV